MIDTFGISVAVAGAVVMILTRPLIPYLRRVAGQNIREEGPEAHQTKQGTPSMGGIAMVIAIVAASFVALFGTGLWQEVLLLDAGLLLFTLVGFLDDYLKIVKKENEGLKVKPKFAIQFLGAIALAVYIGYFSGIGTDIYIPFAKVYIDLGGWYIPFIVFTILAMVNAVNLTDGLDGLAAGTTAIVSAALALVATNLITSLTDSDSVIVFLGAIFGACLFFLYYNHHPARIFMGDTGSLALGGGITVAAIAMKMELLLPIMGLVYVLEALSVILQVLYFKKTGGKRLFRMAPLHHHFELGGMKETRVVLLFWGVTFLCCVVGYLA